MPISTIASAVEAAPLSASLPLQRRPDAAVVERETGSSGAGVHVTISAAARAAAETAPITTSSQAGAAQPLPPQASVNSSPVQAATASTAPELTTHLTVTPPSTGTGTTVAGRATEQVLPTAADPAAREPDAATTDRNQAVQLYLDNAVRTNDQPLPSAIRASA